jgi:hypothetical protein
VDQNPATACTTCGAELPADAGVWCPLCGAALSSNGDGWEISSAPPVANGPPELRTELPPGAGRRRPLASCRDFTRRLTARPRLLVAVAVAGVVVLAGIGTGAFLLTNRGGTDQLYPVPVDGKTGFINRDGEMVIEPRQMDNMLLFASFSEGLAMVSVDGKAGFIDTKGDYVIEPEYEGASSFSEGLAAVWQGGQASYIDKTGKLVIQLAVMAEGGDFSEGLASFGVYDNEAWAYGYLDHHGNVVISPRFVMVGEFSEGLAAVAIEDEEGGCLFGYIDKTGTWVVQPAFRGGAAVFSEGLAAASKDGAGDWGYIDKTGAWVIEPTFASAQPFSEGLAEVALPDEGGEYPQGFIDKSGTMVIQPAFAEASGFSEGLAAAARLDESGELLWGYVDKTGEWVVEPQYQQAGPFRPGGLAMVERSGLPTPDVEWGPPLYEYGAWQGGPYASSSTPSYMSYIDKTGKVIWASSPQTPAPTSATDPLYPVPAYSLLGYIDKSGTLVIQVPGMLDSGKFSEGLAHFSATEGESQKYGYIDSSGNVVIKPQFEAATEFSEGLAAVALGDGDGDLRCGYIDMTGAWVIKPGFTYFTYLAPFSGGLAVASRTGPDAGEWGYIDKTGAWAIQPKFAAAQPFSEGLGAVGISLPLGNQMQWRFVDKTGKTVVEPQFDMVGDFSQGMAAIGEIDDSGALKWGYIDASGNVVVQPQYVYAGPFLPGGLAMVSRSWAGLNDMRSALSSVRVEPRLPDDVAYIDRTGKVVWQTPLD